jgi:hypothetical protein
MQQKSDKAVERLSLIVFQLIDNVKLLQEVSMETD